MPVISDPTLLKVDCRKRGNFIVPIYLHSQKAGFLTDALLGRIWVTDGKETWQGEFNRDETSTHQTSPRLRSVARDCTAPFRPKMDVHVIVEITLEGATHLLRTTARIGEAY
jgi:hypothetical protein